MKFHKAAGEFPPLLPEVRSPAATDGATVSSAVFNLSTTIIGAGIMSIPATLKVLGVGPAIILIFAVAYMCDMSADFLLRYTLSSESTGYAGIMAQSFGKIGSLALQICIAVTTIGCLIMYLIIIGDVLCGAQSDEAVHLGVLQEWFGVHWWNTRAFVLLIILASVILPLVLLRRVDSLRFTSAISVVLAVVFMVISSAMAIAKLIQGTAESPRLLPDLSGRVSFFDLFTVIPVMVTAFTFHPNVHPIRSELRKPSEMTKAVRISLITCASIYTTVGFFCYLLFGDSTMDDVLSNFDRTYSNSPMGVILNLTVRLTYALHLLLVYPAVNFSMRINVDGIIFPRSPPLASASRFVWLTLFLLGFVYLAAIAFPSIWSLFQFVGSTTAVCIVFVFPGAIVLRDVHGLSTGREKIFATIMIVVAVIASAIAISTNVFNLIASKTKRSFSHLDLSH